MDGQQNYRKNTNQWIPNEQERSSYIPSLFVDNIQSSSNNQFTGVSRVAWGGVEDRGRPPSSMFATSGHPFNLNEYKHPDIFIFIIFDCRNSSADDANDNRRRRRLKAWFIFAGLLLTVVTLATMIIIIYLLIVIIKLPTTTTGENNVLFLK